VEKLKCLLCGQRSEFWLGDICLFCKRCRCCSSKYGDIRLPFGGKHSFHSEEGRCLRDAHLLEERDEHNNQERP
jgi:hypothetical protein